MGRNGWFRYLVVGALSAIACDPSIAPLSAQAGSDVHDDLGERCECDEVGRELAALRDNQGTSVFQDVRRRNGKNRKESCQFSLSLLQPVDHFDPKSATFAHEAILIHRGKSAALALSSFGYQLPDKVESSPLANLLSANELIMPHRYYPGAQPTANDERYLTSKQAAADSHAFFQAIHKFYPQSVPFAYGRSKGALMTLFWRQHYPEDDQQLAGSLLVGTPVLNARNDPRVAARVTELDRTECDGKLMRMQRLLFTNVNNPSLLQELMMQIASRAEAISTVSDGKQDSFSQALGDDEGKTFVQQLILAFPLAFLYKQAALSLHCVVLPEDPSLPQAVDQLFITYNADTRGFGRFSDRAIQANRPFHYQLLTELGAPALALPGGINVGPAVASGMVGVDLIADPAWCTSPPAFHPEVQNELAAWMDQRLHRTIFLYGETDPWAGAAPGARLWENRSADVLRLDVPKQAHFLTFNDPLSKTVWTKAQTQLELWKMKQN